MILTDIFTRILTMSLTAAVLIIVVLLLRLALGKASKICSYMLWAVVLLRLLCPFTFDIDFSALGLVSTEQIIDGWSDTYVEDYYTYEAIDAKYDAAINAGREVQHSVYGTDYVVTAGDGLSAPKTVSDTVLPVLSALWLLGVCGMLMFSIISALRIYRITNKATAVQKSVYLADGIPTAFVLGVFRPKIYLPAELTEEEQVHILLHEKHHIRRGDHIFKALGFLILALHWFNPLVWIAFNLACRDMEMSCDEAVVRKIGVANRSDYASTLLKMCFDASTPVGLPLAFGEGDPKERIRNLSNWKQPRVWVKVLCLLLCILLTGCFSVSIQSEQGNSEQLLLSFEPLDKIKTEPRILFEDFLTLQTHHMGVAFGYYGYVRNIEERSGYNRNTEYLVDPKIVEWNQLSLTLYVATVEGSYSACDFSKVRFLYYVGRIMGSWYVIDGHLNLPDDLKTGIKLDAYEKLWVEYAKERIGLGENRDILSSLYEPLDNNPHYKDPRWVFDDYIEQWKHSRGRADKLYGYFGDDKLLYDALYDPGYIIEPEIHEWTQLSDDLYVAIFEGRTSYYGYHKIRDICYVGRIDDRWYVICPIYLPDELKSDVDLTYYNALFMEEIWEARYRARGKVLGVEVDDSWLEYSREYARDSLP